MLRVALQMFAGDRAKYLGLLFGPEWEIPDRVPARGSFALAVF